MKSKKLIIFLSTLAFLAVLIVLNSTLFTLQNVSIDWLTTKYELKSVSDGNIVEQVNMGGSIFLLNKEEIAYKLEKKYSYLKIVNIETKFPNKIIIHSAERESLYAVELSHNNFAVLDEEGKVLRFADSTIFARADLGAKPIRVSFESIMLNEDDFKAGEMVKVDAVQNVLEQLSTSLRESNYIPTNSKGIFLTINVLNKGEVIDVNMSTRYGINIYIKDVGQNTTEKFLLGIERYNFFHQEGVVGGTIEVWNDSLEGRIYARYVA